MKALFGVGVLLIVLGITSLFIAIPQREQHGVKIGDASIGVQTETSRKVAPAVSAALIIGGAVLVFAGRRRTAA
jgi:hypothetical protein